MFPTIEISGKEYPVIRNKAEYVLRSKYCMPAWCDGCVPNMKNNKCMSCGKALVPQDELEKLALYV